MTLIEALKHLFVCQNYVNDEGDEESISLIDIDPYSEDSYTQEMYDLLVKNFKSFIQDFSDEPEETWEKITTKDLSEEDWEKLMEQDTESSLYGDEELYDLKLIYGIINAAWLTCKDIDYDQRKEDDDLDDLCEDEYDYYIEIGGGTYSFETKTDIDLT